MGHDYHARLGLMEDWYRELVHHPNREEQLLLDYGPHISFLNGLRGSVLDVGGGAGIAARFLHPGVRYVVVDPSAVWEMPEWVEFGRAFRGSGPEPEFVKASGEQLPFDDDEFDSVISFWSLNHAADPKRCIGEIARVLRSGGSAYFVVDDVEPNWPDLLSDAAARTAYRFAGRHRRARISVPLKSALLAKSRGAWPIASDHLPITQKELLSWLAGELAVTHHLWLEGSLTCTATKP